MTRSRILPLIMWSLPLLFFAFQFILRLWPGLLIDEIMAQFSIDASTFGVLAAAWYAGYASMQIPVAILLDKYGARNIVFLSAVICGIATISFTYIDNFYAALLSRFLIGAASATGFLGTSKVISEWFSKENYTKMIGLTFTLGFIGAIYGGKPVSLLIDQYDPEIVSTAFALLSILIGIVSYLTLRPPKIIDYQEQNEFKLSALLSLLSSRTIWILGIVMLLLVGTLEGFADVWGVPFLMTNFQLNKSDAAGLLSWIYIGVLFGGPFLAYCGQKFGNYTSIMFCGLTIAFSFPYLFTLNDFNWGLVAILLFIIGATYCYQVVTFAAAAELVETQYLGVTIAFLNCMGMIGGSFFHISIGRIVDYFWTGTINANGGRIYTLETYKYAISIIPMAGLLGAALIFGLAIKIKKSRKARITT